MARWRLHLNRGAQPELQSDIPRSHIYNAQFGSRRTVGGHDNTVEQCYPSGTGRPESFHQRHVLGEHFELIFEFVGFVGCSRCGELANTSRRL